jgi:hypothetical protein
MEARTPEQMRVGTVVRTRDSTRVTLELIGPKTAVTDRAMKPAGTQAVVAGPSRPDAPAGGGWLACRSGSAGVNPGDTVSLTITLANDGAENATNLVGNDIHYHYVVSNQGNVDCITPFQVDVYIDEESPPSAGQQSNEWNETVDRLDLGQSRTFDLVLSDADPGEYTAYVQCDTLQAVVESDEGNNVDGPSSQTVGTTDVFELLNPARKWFPQDMDVEFRFAATPTPRVAKQSSFLEDGAGHQ